MNVGEYLVSKSSLSSGTALEHFLTMQTGGGTVTVFAHRLSVAIEQPRLTLVQMPRVEARSDYTPPEARQSGDDKALFVLTRDGVMSVLTATTDELMVRQGRESSVFVRTLDVDRFTVRDAAVIEMES